MSYRAITVHDKSKRKEKYISKKNRQPDFPFEACLKDMFFLKHNGEQKNKSSFSTDVDFSKIHAMKEKELPYEEKILKKGNEGKKLSKKEAIIFRNLNDKKEKQVKNDIERLEKYGIHSKISTDIGRILKYILTAKKLLEKDKNPLILYIKHELSNFNIPLDIKKKYLDILKKIDTVVDKLDTIKLQFNELNSYMPPLNVKGFNKLDDWQINFIKNIDNKKSTIILAPTSAGKTYLSCYTFVDPKARALVVAPTSPIAWQFAALIGSIRNADIPLITETFQSSSDKNKLFQKIKKTNIVVGTPNELVDFLPYLDLEFDWIIMDEIHMIGEKVCNGMETILKYYNDTPLIGLSATIGNIDIFKEWFDKIGYKDISVIKCEKRFINLQRFYYDNLDFKRIHPLSNIKVSDFKSKSILDKDFQQTPPDIWDLYLKLKEEFDLGDKDPYKYFNSEQRITLDDSNLYFKELLNFIHNKYKTDQPKIKKIMKSYKSIKLDNHDFDLVDISFKLKEINKLPALIYLPKNRINLVSDFCKKVNDMEKEKYPKRFQEKIKEEKAMKHLEKKREKLKLNDMPEKKLERMMQNDSTINSLISTNSKVYLMEPHNDFIFSRKKEIHQGEIENYASELKQYFKPNGIQYHYLIELLSRSVGLYAKGLPERYLRIVQSLASCGKLAIVFSDEQLVHGVSMPFRSTIITPDPELNPLMCRQLEGRAGRRGLDKEGNTIFLGYSWSQIKELITGKIPFVEGNNSIVYGSKFAEKIRNNDKWEKTCVNYLNEENNDKINQNYILQQLSPIEGKWNYCISEDEHINHMLWRFRDSYDCFRLPYIIPFIQKKFCNCKVSDVNDQIAIGKFYSRFIEVREPINDKDVLCVEENSDEDKILTFFEKVDLGLPKKIDSKIFKAIEQCRIEISNLDELEKERERLYIFSLKLKYIQHYFYYIGERDHENEEISIKNTGKMNKKIASLMAKLLTRIWWIYHQSSPIIN